eukprot:CAMPEP_0184484870 /NCGR_PEP_ID=MMETSP0113_2-20130426/6537_1 /TAXON_ID=91329 /ORGANISM="Norrisiella sphaerica, Strain BC52" /LENGTH=361 /DNA_ID=CAMNT_0026866055 /DNA_START=138 /DNA_END=1223 /DNA_ORIENTATION=+
MIRTYNPSPGMIKRFGEIIKESGREVILAVNREDRKELVFRDLMMKFGDGSSEIDYNVLNLNFTKMESFLLNTRGQQYVNKIMKLAAVPEQNAGPEGAINAMRTEMKFSAIIPAVMETMMNDVSKMYNSYHKHIVEYSFEDILNEFPGLRDLPNTVDKMNENGHLEWTNYVNHSTLWNMHDEPIWMMMNTKYEQKFGKKWDGCAVWSLEDDVEFTGDWSTFFDSYTGRADLIGYNLQTKPITPPEGEEKWLWIGSWTKGFNKFVQNGEVYWHQEHTVQYSRQLLDLMGHEMKINKVHGISEAATPTITIRSGLKYLNLEHVKNPDLYTWLSGDPEIQAACEKAANNWRKKGKLSLIHPAKW